jgi:hypothetical protein
MSRSALACRQCSSSLQRRPLLAQRAALQQAVQHIAACSSSSWRVQQQRSCDTCCNAAADVEAPTAAADAAAAVQPKQQKQKQPKQGKQQQKGGGEVATAAMPLQQWYARGAGLRASWNSSVHQQGIWLMLAANEACIFWSWMLFNQLHSNTLRSSSMQHAGVGFPAAVEPRQLLDRLAQMVDSSHCMCVRIVGKASEEAVTPKSGFPAAVEPEQLLNNTNVSDGQLTA